MIDNDKKEFSDLMTGVFEMYGKEPSSALLSLYWVTLGKYDFEDVKRAAIAHTMKSAFMPKPSDFVSMIDGDTESLSMIAYNNLIKAIGKVGPYRTVVFDDPLIHFCVEKMGGWTEVCKWSDEDLPFRGHEFRKLYTGTHGRKFEFPNRLRGVVELHNSIEGGPIAPPTLIGNRMKAENVLTGGHQPKALEVSIGPKLTEITSLAKSIDNDTTE